MEEETNDKEETNEPNFNDYTEAQLERVLRFTSAVAERNAKLDEAVAQAKEFAAKRNRGETGKVAEDDDEESAAIKEQVTSWLRRTKRK